MYKNKKKKVNIKFISADTPITLNFNNKKINEIDKDYVKETIDFINYLSGKKEVTSLFERNDINYWQFMPSYIHIPIRMSLKISDLLKKTNIKISPEIILEHCVEKGIFMGSIQKRWVGDLDFILNLLKRKLSRIFLSQKKIKKVDTLFISQPKNLKNGIDSEFSGIIEYFEKKKKESLIIEAPYFADRVGVPKLTSIRKLRSERCSKILFYDNFETLSCLYAATKERLKNKKWKDLRLSNDNYLNFFVNKILKWSLNIILPYDVIYIQKTSDNILKKIKCKKICVTYEHGPYSKAILISCRKKRIKSFGFVHGAMLHELNEDYSHINVSTNNLKKYLVPSKTFVYNKNQFDSMIKKGSYKRSMIEIIGNWKLKKYHLRREKGKNKYKICFFDGINQFKLHQIIFNASLKAGYNLSDIYYRPHPSQSPLKSYKNWMAVGGLKENILNIKDYDLYEIINKTFICIHDFSSTILDAASFKKNILYTNINFKKTKINLPKNNHFSNENELTKKLIMIKEKNSYKLKNLWKYGLSEVNSDDEIFKNMYDIIFDKN